VRLIWRLPWSPAKGSATAGATSPAQLEASSAWNPGPVRSRRHRVDLLPPHPRQLEALVRPRRDLLLSQHQADLPRLLPSTVEHHLPGPHPVPPHLPRSIIFIFAQICAGCARITFTMMDPMGIFVERNTRMTPKKMFVTYLTSKFGFFPICSYFHFRFPI
jgi:hypothetical protein